MDAKIDRLVYELYGLTEAGEPPFEVKTKAARRGKGVFAKAPEKPVDNLTPEQAFADAAHFYGKEETTAYKPE